jgi:hypothetical protein
MARRLYLVRLRQEFRIVPGFDPYPDDYPHRVRPAYVRAFPSRATAERFIAETPPIAFNPFARHMGFYIHPDGTMTIWGMSAYTPSYGGDDSAEEIIYYEGTTTYFNEWIQDTTGIAPPEIPEEALRTFSQPMKIWMDWWEANKDRMTDAQKAEIWRTLAKDPWEIVEVETA